jgi:hypothetical protein
MNVAKFHKLLDAHGADFSRWPTKERAAAEKLVASDPSVRVFLENARGFDQLIKSRMTKEAIDANAPNRVLAALASKPLPRQHGLLFAMGWPKALLDVDFAPAWPRIAALASVAALGIAIGLFGPDLGLLEGSGWAVASPTMTESDLGMVAFEREPLTGVRP